MGSAGSKPTTRRFSTYTVGTRSPVAGMMKLESKPMSFGDGLISPFQSGPPIGPSPRCHLPTTAVTYPAFFRTEGSVVRPGSIIKAASPGRTPVPGWRNAYSPVSSAYRDGVQVAAAEWASAARQVPLTGSNRQLVDSAGGEAVRDVVGGGPVISPAIVIVGVDARFTERSRAFVGVVAKARDRVRRQQVEAAREPFLDAKQSGV